MTRDEAVAKWNSLPEPIRGYVISSIGAMAIEHRREGFRDDMDREARADKVAEITHDLAARSHPALALGLEFGAAHLAAGEQRSVQHDLCEAFELVYFVLESTKVQP